MYSALFMIAFGIFTKFGALFVTIPDPIIGGTFFILFGKNCIWAGSALNPFSAHLAHECCVLFLGMIVAVGISNLQYVDLNSSRNLFIIGFSFFNGLALSEFAKNNLGVINTGSVIFSEWNYSGIAIPQSLLLKLPWCFELALWWGSQNSHASKVLSTFSPQNLFLRILKVNFWSFSPDFNCMHRRSRVRSSQITFDVVDLFLSLPCKCKFHSFMIAFSIIGWPLFMR